MPTIDIKDLTQDELELIIKSRVETDDPYRLDDLDEAGRLRRRAERGDIEKAPKRG